MSVGVLLFPGTNCEADVIEAMTTLGGRAELVWHGDRALGPHLDSLVIPGGFAHGDYLRTGAIARFSPIMTAVAEFARQGGPVLGICNGFQILCEAGLLPGALQKNIGLKFVCETSTIRVDSVDTPVTRDLTRGTELCLPINHFEGNFTCSPETLAELRSEERIVFTYVSNPNGSLADIAGVCSTGRNVVGLMPHPERACHPLLGSTDGARLFEGLVAALTSPG
jgi:phosphoribosylformylglycinamidine synthase